MATQQQIQLLVQQLHDGKGNPVKSDPLGASLGMPPGRTQEPTRKLIREARMDHNYPIAGGRSGYFLIDSQAELQEEIASLQSRIDALELLKGALRAGWVQRQTSRGNKLNWPK